MMKRRARAFTDIYNWAIRNQKAFATLEKEGSLTVEQSMTLELYDKIINMAINSGATYADEVEMMMSL